jgi:drug/metabolite transporter (DMT)-like permease
LSLAGLALLPAIPFLSPSAWATSNIAGWAAVLWLALGSSIVAYAAWYHALRVGGVVQTAPLQFAQPVTGLILAVALMGETITPALVLAATVILAGIALARR